MRAHVEGKGEDNGRVNLLFVRRESNGKTGTGEDDQGGESEGQIG